MQPLEVLEVFFYLLHLSLDVAVGNDGLGADDASLGEVESVEQDGYFGFMRDVVEAFLPLGLRFSCSFRRDAESEPLCLSCLLGDDVGGVHLLGAVDGYAAQSAHEDADGPKEPLLLHEEVAVEAFGPAVDVADDEVPVAGVRREGDDALFGHGFGDVLREAEPPEKCFVTESLQHVTDF